MSDRLVLRHTHISAGRTIDGVLIVTNPGHGAVNLNHGCRLKYAIVLTNDRIPPDAIFPMDCGAGPFLIPPGTTRLPVTMSTNFGSCSNDPGRANSVPACLRGSGIPPLPPGSYQAVLVSNGLQLPDPEPVSVTVTAPPR